MKLAEHMGTEIGEFARRRSSEAACAEDATAAAHRRQPRLEGLAIDVFNTMKLFGDHSGDPVLAACEDWMLADEVTR